MGASYSYPSTEEADADADSALSQEQTDAFASQEETDSQLSREDTYSCQSQQETDSSSFEETTDLHLLRGKNPAATMGSISNDSGQGLGNRALLDKVDKLRELGISHLVPLPQMVVVGDQSAGKSSVLESLTGFHFPRSVTLCTRHATEIICRREQTESVVISIIPKGDDPERAKRAREFRRVASRIGSEDFGQIFEDAAEVMGIKSNADDYSGGSAFSQDVLRVEISGPQADHLTIIDVPGMFETITPGLTTESDIDLVKNMVKNYIQETRTIILAVVPCTGDIANQKILRFAAEADPEGKRTLGVLTKPDLAVENATKGVICDLVNGKRRDLHLGYCVVKNRGADDTSSSMERRHQQEQTLFGQEPWNTLPADRLGIPALRVRIQQLLMDRTKSEFPVVRNEIMSRLRTSQHLLDDMGESRSTTDQQRAYIGKIASRFTQLKNYGLDAYYTRHRVFSDLELRLITRIRTINEAYSVVMHRKGHTREFDKTSSAVAKREEEKLAGLLMSDMIDGLKNVGRAELYDGMIGFTIPSLGEEELDRILVEPYCCPEPMNDDMLEHIQVEYLTSRGYEIGNFSSELLPCTFKEQAKKWQDITRAHVANATLIVHHFICSIVEQCCPDVGIRQELWSFLMENLQERYRRAMDHVEFLISVEFEGKSITYDPVFERTLSEISGERAEGLRQDAADSAQDGLIPVHMLGKILEKLAIGKDTSVETTRQKIHDVLYTYYDIARSRFIDVVCQQVIDHFLLHAPGGPLAVLSDQVVLEMTPDQLEAIAGEDMGSRGKRERLVKDIDMLSKALKILRG
ncbi:Interferon-induced GTP-binding protein Mx1 [Cladobotryum mycophilum]|uniref:Interferon-induced GTP-binding protein Mx1 n=1 Tax=Cladobotryum mycophilum TaxID=491253 RepID=A0ABR0SGP6_9HYPO